MRHKKPDFTNIIPSDRKYFTHGVCRALYVAYGGNISVKTGTGEKIIFKKVKSGTTIPVQIIRVNKTGTTAQGIIAWY